MITLARRGFDPSPGMVNKKGFRYNKNYLSILIILCRQLTDCTLGHNSVVLSITLDSCEGNTMGHFELRIFKLQLDATYQMHYCFSIQLLRWNNRYHYNALPVFIGLWICYGCLQYQSRIFVSSI